MTCRLLHSVHALVSRQLGVLTRTFQSKKGEYENEESNK